MNFSKNENARIGLLAAAVALAGCSNAVLTHSGENGTAQQDVTIAHAFDLASKMPPHLAVMFSMSWFGIPSSDPQGAGPDPSYGNAKWGGGCVATADPAVCNSCILYGAGDTCLQTGAPQREMASRRRMLAGIYSASAQDTEALRRVDLMLSNLRRSCDDGAKLDAWTAQLNGTRDTELHPGNPSCSTCNISYRATVGLLDEADKAGLANAVMPGDDATWYFHFGSDVGLGKCDDSSGNPKQNCIDALTQDLTDMATLALAHPSSLRVNGRPVLFFYVDPGYLSAAQWSSMMQSARNAVGHDFYTVATLQNATRTDYFQAFDALAPWVQLDWNSSSGSTVRQHAYNYAAGLHDAIFNAVGSYPGRVAFGGVAPGFDDFTENWGRCEERQLPPGDPRDPNVLPGEFDYLAAKSAKGVILETWDDWTEGTEFEPDVEGGTSMLVSLRDNLGRLYGEPYDSAGDARLTNRWMSFGQARNCSGGSAGTSPVIDLTCPSGGGNDAGSGGGTDAGSTGGSCSTPFNQVSNNSVGGWDPTYQQFLVDVNGDKRDDLVILWNNGNAYAQVTLSDGTQFNRAWNGPAGAWSSATRTLPMDVNGDGKEDLVRIAQNGTSADALVLASDGTGFNQVSNASVGGWDTRYVDLAMDVNGDGKDDLVILWDNVDTWAQVTISNGTSFDRVSNASLGAPFNVADRFYVLDANGDGKKDLLRLYANGTAAYGELFLSNGAGFTSVWNQPVGGWSTAWVDLVGDVNGDGKDDFVILWNNGGNVSAQIDVSTGSGFQQVSNASLGIPFDPASRYWLRDVNGDRRADLTTAHANGTAFNAQVATSNGTAFAPQADQTLGGWSSAWVDLMGDVDGDGKSDLVVLWQDTTQVAGNDDRAQVTLSRCQ